MVRPFAFAAALASLLAACLAASVAPAQQPGQQPAPRIGLVLAGGGAAGVAHVGVIRALEARGLRPDIVVGASMGAIVGGLYAAGYTPDDLEAVVQDVDWPSILNDLADRSFVHPMRRDSRIDLNDVSTDLPLGVGAGGIAVAGGLVDGIRLSLILRQLAAPALGTEDFDDLPIPFRAVATDLATGRPVALEGGDLALALRASMSIPALFPPVRIGDRFLVDGGVSNNLPIDVARAMGADRVIAVFIPPADVDPTALGALSSSLSQTMSIFIHARSRELIETLGPDDLLITPDVGAVGMLDFVTAPETVEKGVAAAEAEAAALDRLMRGRVPAEPRQSIAAEFDQPIHYDRVIVEYDGVLDPEVILRRLGLPETGPATPQQVQDAVQRVQGLGLFQNVSYRFDDAEDGRVLVVRAERRRLGFAQLRFGLGLNTEFGDSGGYTIALGARFTELNALGLRVDADAAFGQVEGVRLVAEQPLDFNHSLFLRGTALYLARTAPLFVTPDRRQADFRAEQVLFGGDLLWTPGDWGRVGVGASWQMQRARLRTGSADVLDDLGIERDYRRGLRLGPRFDYDTLDDPDLPRRGLQIGAAVDFDPFGDADRDQGELIASGLGAWSWGQNTVSAFGVVEGELRANGLEPHFLGGFQRLSGFSENALFGNVVGMGGLRYYRRFGFDSPFGREAFAGASAEYGGAWADWSDVGVQGAYAAGSVFAGVQTIFGPLIFGVGFAETGQFSLTLGLGARF